ncbi:prepilin-type N-terminal cleavage/methylation domain-containing protein [Clostridiales Family XIII bacterium PM5-7]
MLEMRKMLSKKLNKKGFTLAELLVVVAIIAILVAVSIPIFTGRLEKSREATDVANMRAAKGAAVTAYLSDDIKPDATGSAWKTTTAPKAKAYYFADEGVFVATKAEVTVPYGKGTATDGGTSFGKTYTGTTVADGKVVFVIIDTASGAVEVDWE